MKNLILLTLLSMFSFLSLGQSYPRIETDSTGKQLVVMTLEQAQKIDNAFELLKLLEKAGNQCDSLTLSYVKVIDVLKRQTTLLEVDLNLYKGQVIDKDKQLSNLNERLANCEKDASECDKQISVRDEQIVLLNDEIKTIKTKRNIAYGVGVVGIIGGILLVLVLH